MTPKEKARELVNRFTKEAENFEDGTCWNYDKQCALVCIDTILKGSRLYYIEDYTYWEEVKQEINKL